VMPPPGRTSAPDLHRDLDFVADPYPVAAFVLATSCDFENSASPTHSAVKFGLSAIVK
jgi:hypothetical protein